MPHTLHEELAHTAEREAVSLNQLIVRILSRSTVDATVASTTPDTMPTDATVPAERSRTLGVALALNLVVVGLAGLVAIALLVAAWRDGF